jgi:hypothetical protein
MELARDAPLINFIFGLWSHIIMIEKLNQHSLGQKNYIT